MDWFSPQLVFNRTRAAWVKIFLLLFLAGVGSSPLPGATNHASAKFETPPPLKGSIQWDNLQRINKERQEIYRKRVAIPNAVGANVPLADGANVVNRQLREQSQSNAPAPAAISFPKLLLFGVLLAVAGALLARKFAPEILTDLNQRFNPWAEVPAGEWTNPATVRTEEASFEKFAADFHVGPSASTRLATPTPEDPCKIFFVQAAELVHTQRQLLQKIIQETSGLARQKKLAQLRAEMSTLKDAANFPEVLSLWQVASAVEGLLKQLTDKMGDVTPSTLRAVGGGVELLDDLCRSGLKLDLIKDKPLKFLVVDDDMISRQALSLALKKTFSQPDLAVDGETALTQASQQVYDVIFLDVQLPGMDGFELCTKIRNSTLNRETPVVFVTGHSDFDARAQSTLSGGNDLMGKPFLTFEVTVKALTLGLRGRLQQRLPKPVPKTVASPIPALSSERSPDMARPSASATLAPRPPLATPAESAEFIKSFLVRAATHLEPLRDICQTILQTPNEETRQNLLADGFLNINSLTARTGSGIGHPGYQMCVALEGLFRKLLESPKKSTASALATIAAAVDLLDELCVPEMTADFATQPPIELLVVDDDLIARRALVGALQTAFKKPDSVESGEAALALAMAKSFDVIFLDVVMPGMDGFEVCTKIRESGANRTTPVVFVTGHDDFNARAQMVRTGGDDLQGKPFLTAEITVKALTFALRARLALLKTPQVV